MTQTSIPAFATSIAGNHYRNVGFIDVTSRPRPIVMLVFSKVVVVQVGAKLQSLLMDSLRLYILVSK